MNRIISMQLQFGVKQTQTIEDTGLAYFPFCKLTKLLVNITKKGHLQRFFLKENVRLDF